MVAQDLNMASFEARHTSLAEAGKPGGKEGEALSERRRGKGSVGPQEPDPTRPLSHERVRRREGG